MAQQILIGRTGSAEYFLRGMWVYRKTPNGAVCRYDTMEGFALEWDSGAYLRRLLERYRRRQAPARPLHHQLINRPAPGVVKAPPASGQTGVPEMRTVKNNETYTAGQVALSIMAGWTPGLQLSFDPVIIDPVGHAREIARAAAREKAQADAKAAAEQAAAAKAKRCKPRKCLTCLTMFSSFGPGNRRCSGCRERATCPWPVEYSIAAF
jgi:hypothetical protein